MYDRAYAEKPSTTSPGNPVGVTNPILFLLLLQHSENSLKESTSLKETYVLTIFGL